MSKLLNEKSKSMEIKQNTYEQTYAVGWSKDSHILFETSSGGAFRVFAEHILKKGGWVFGTEFNRQGLAQVKGYNDERVQRFSGSKYVKSSVGDAFSHIKNYLDEGKPVLFGGTPCQCKALRSFLKKEYENLYIVDIICHGSPRPSVFQAYIEYLEKKQHSQVKDIKFRNKEKGWKQGQIEVQFEDGSMIKEFFHPKKNLYANVFYSNVAFTPGCVNCKFNHMDRVGDITLGDFWGYKSYPDLEINEDGTSVFIINTQNGRNLMQGCKDDMYFYAVDRKAAMANNPPLYEHASINPLTKIFCSCVEKYGFYFSYILCLKVLRTLLLPVRALRKLVKR